MTREEAADLLDNLIGMVEDNQENDYDEALKMAIEALNVTDTNVGDTISRQAAIDALYHVDEYNGRSVEAIKNLPPAQPEQAIKDCRNCKHGRYNDYHKTMFCYNSDDCTDWNLWEPAELSSEQSEGWMERNEERILQAGMEGREIEFRIGGRLFAIREKAQ